MRRKFEGINSDDPLEELPGINLNNRRSHIPIPTKVWYMMGGIEVLYL